MSKPIHVLSGTVLDEDTLVVVWGPEADVATAVQEVFIRAREALLGVPPETRQAFSDGTNGFELWTTDGTTAGTRLLADVQPGPTGSQPRRLFDFNGRLRGCLLLGERCGSRYHANGHGRHENPTGEHGCSHQSRHSNLNLLESWTRFSSGHTLRDSHSNR